MKKDIEYGFVTVPFDYAIREWALPGGLFTKSKSVATKAARNIDTAIRRSENFYKFERHFNLMKKGL